MQHSMMLCNHICRDRDAEHWTLNEVWFIRNVHADLMQPLSVRLPHKELTTTNLLLNTDSKWKRGQFECAFLPVPIIRQSLSFHILGFIGFMFTNNQTTELHDKRTFSSDPDLKGVRGAAMALCDQLIDHTRT